MTDGDQRPKSRSHREDDGDGGTTKLSSSCTGNIFSVPPAVEKVFDNFPLVKYEENALTVRAPRRSSEHVLYVFASESDARAGRPSINPTCLKWQTYLKFSGLKFRLASSSNHASPSGALPFLLPAAPSSEATKPADPVSSKTLRNWLASQKSATQLKETANVRYETYASLLDNRIRKAWLFQLYLAPSNASVVHQFYVDPCSSNAFVRLSIARQLHQAAASEIVNASTNSTIVEPEIIREAGEALSALSSLLAEDDWFFGRKEPGDFDASVFAYTHLIKHDEAIRWQENTLLSLLKRHPNLLQHQMRIANMYYD